jgi:hypothetical protein
VEKSIRIPARKINKVQIFIGVAGLLLGSLIYIIDRPPDQTYFIYASKINISLYNTLPNIFGFIGDTLPAFIHVFSFILITAGLILCKRKGYLIVCLSWFLIDCAFEFGQKFYIFPVKIIPHWFKNIPFLENTESYFIHGTFDLIDLAAIALGAIAAYLVVMATNKRRMLT